MRLTPQPPPSESAYPLKQSTAQQKTFPNPNPMYLATVAMIRLTPKSLSLSLKPNLFVLPYLDHKTRQPSPREKCEQNPLTRNPSPLLDPLRLPVASYQLPSRRQARTLLLPPPMFPSMLHFSLHTTRRRVILTTSLPSQLGPFKLLQSKHKLSAPAPPTHDNRTLSSLVPLPIMLRERLSLTGLSLVELGGLPRKLHLTLRPSQTASILQPTVLQHQMTTPQTRVPVLATPM